MKLTTTLLFFLLAFSFQGCTQAKDKQTFELYPIVENGLWGFINHEGVVVIQPRFRAAGEFSEGTAPRNSSSRLPSRPEYTSANPVSKPF